MSHAETSLMMAYFYIQWSDAVEEPETARQTMQIADTFIAEILHVADSCLKAGEVRVVDDEDDE